MALEGGGLQWAWAKMDGFGCGGEGSFRLLLPVTEADIDDYSPRRSGRSVCGSGKFLATALTGQGQYFRTTLPTPVLWLLFARISWAAGGAVLDDTPTP